MHVQVVSCKARFNEPIPKSLIFFATAIIVCFLMAGESYGEAVTWMDSTSEEVAVWTSMISNPNHWIDATLPIRTNLAQWSEWLTSIHKHTNTCAFTFSFNVWTERTPYTHNLSVIIKHRHYVYFCFCKYKHIHMKRGSSEGSIEN